LDLNLTNAVAATAGDVWWWILGIAAVVGLIWWWSAASGQTRARAVAGGPEDGAASGEAATAPTEGSGGDQGQNPPEGQPQG
jgi:hypothetical protein